MPPVGYGWTSKTQVSMTSIVINALNKLENESFLNREDLSNLKAVYLYSTLLSLFMKVNVNATCICSDPKLVVKLHISFIKKFG